MNRQISRFYPSGYIGLHTAAYMMASTGYPDRWRQEAMSEAEWNAWQREESGYGHAIFTAFKAGTLTVDSEGTIERWRDFYRALTVIRKELDAGNLVAKFRRSDGSWGHVKTESWAIPAAEEVLLSGHADLVGEQPERLILLAVAELVKLFEKSTPEHNASPIEPDDYVGQKISAAIEERNDAFAKWVEDRTDRRSNFGDRLTEPSLIQDDLVGAAMLGLLEPNEAENLAIELGCGPLAKNPDAGAYRPEQQVYWTLPMAIAWIATRKTDAVRNQMTSYREQCWEWRHRDRVGLPKDGKRSGIIISRCWELKQPAAPTRAVLASDCDIASDDSRMSPADANNELWRALTDGQLPATGKQNGGSRAAIPAMLWQDLGWHALDPDSLVEGVRNGTQQKAWENVTVAQNDVLRVWQVCNEIGSNGSAVNFDAPKRAHKVAAVADIIREQWPNGIPKGLSAKSRNATIVQAFAAKQLGSVSPRTIVKALAH